jgi:hypothetical protein
MAMTSANDKDAEGSESNMKGLAQVRQKKNLKGKEPVRVRKDRKEGALHPYYT